MEPNGFSDFESVATKNEATDFNGKKPQKSNGYDGITDENPPEGVSRVSDGDPFALLKDPSLKLQPRKE